MVFGASAVGLALATTYWAAVVIWAIISASGVLFNINTGSLRQAITPNEMLGRVLTIAAVAATACSPLGAILGGLAIEWTGDIALVFGAIGLLTVLIAAGFSFSAIGHAEEYIPAMTPAREPEPSVATHSV